MAKKTAVVRYKGPAAAEIVDNQRFDKGKKVPVEGAEKIAYLKNKAGFEVIEDAEGASAS
jgi:hypothetical protein